VEIDIKGGDIYQCDKMGLHTIFLSNYSFPEVFRPIIAIFPDWKNGETFTYFSFHVSLSFIKLPSYLLPME
jgi:hypothetical protein